MIEEWKTVTTHPDYQISNFGRLKTFKQSTKYKSTGDTTGMIMSPCRVVVMRKYTYLANFLTGIGDNTSLTRSRWQKIHRLVALAFIPNPDNKPEVNHIDGNKLNNHVTNLEWVTHQENIQKGHDNGQWGVYPTGEAHHRYGKKASVSTRQKQKAAKLGKNHPKYKGYYIIDGRKYYSANQAGKDLQIPPITIIRRIKRNVLGYKFVPDPDKTA